jgi:hypothetical protein
MHLERLSPELTIPGLSPEVLSAALSPRLTLLWGASVPSRTLLSMVALLAARGQAPRLFDGGNRFDGYFVARLVRRLTDRPYAVMSRLRLSRAFTCFQLAELIENTAPDGSPLFVLDLLSTFYDESVPLRDVERLLAETIAHLKGLACSGPVIVGACEPQALVKERWALLDQLQLSADSAWMLRAPAEAAVEQPRLFEA